MPKIPQTKSSSALAASNNSSSIGQAGRFGLVGIINTLVDFVLATIIANVLGASVIYGSLFGFTLTGVIIGSIIGGCVAMINSYILNLRFTFKAHSHGLRQALLFFGITGFGLIILRPIVIHAVTDWWTGPVDLAYFISQAINLPLTRSGITSLVGVGSGIIFIWPYNFILYKKIVFKLSPITNKKEV